MGAENDIPTIISYAKTSQVNAQIKISQGLIFNGGFLDPLYSRKLYLIRSAVEFMNNSYSANPFLRSIAEYLFALSRPFMTNTATISITNPSNVNINVGQNATFTVSVFVSNAAPYTIQWYRNGIAILGATSLSYTLSNAQLSDSGAIFYAKAIATGVGNAISASATLTVASVITGFFTYSPIVDFYPVLLTNSDPFSYGTSYMITHNADISIPLPSGMPSNQYMLAKIPISEPVKANWFNTPLNNGTVPDPVFESIVQFGGFTYYASRGQVSMDVTQPLVLKT